MMQTRFFFFANRIDNTNPQMSKHMDAKPTKSSLEFITDLFTNKKPRKIIFHEML